MGRVSIKLDGVDLEKLITGETLKFSVHIIEKEGVIMRWNFGGF